MRLNKYTNLTAGQTLQGVLENGGSAHAEHVLTVRSLTPTSHVGDRIVCPVCGDLYVATYVDNSTLNPSLRPRMRHYTVRLRELHGSATIKRYSPTVDDFGRSIDDAMVDVSVDALTTLPDSRLISVPLSPAGGREFVHEFSLLALTASEIRPGDSLIYRGRTEYRVIDASYIADNLQSVVCRR